MSKRSRIIRAFVVAKQYDESSIPDTLNRGDVVKIMEQRTKELGDSIKKSFPQVRIDGISWCYVSIHIPGRTKKA